MSKVRGNSQECQAVMVQEELSPARGQGLWPGGATPRPRSGGWEKQPHVQGVVARGYRKA